MIIIHNLSLQRNINHIIYLRSHHLLASTKLLDKYHLPKQLSSIHNIMTVGLNISYLQYNLMTIIKTNVNILKSMPHNIIWIKLDAAVTNKIIFWTAPGLLSHPCSFGQHRDY